MPCNKPSHGKPLQRPPHVLSSGLKFLVSSVSPSPFTTHTLPRPLFISVTDFKHKKGRSRPPCKPGLYLLAGTQRPRIHWQPESPSMIRLISKLRFHLHAYHVEQKSASQETCWAPRAWNPIGSHLRSYSYGIVYTRSDKSCIKL